jgi:hypothetical protein
MIETKEDWWGLVDNYWEQLIDIGCRWVDMTQPATVDLTTSTPFIGLTIFDDLEQAKQKRDWERLWLYFSMFWAIAPDNPSIHYIPHWYDLCDLCSENWVFQEV